MNMRKTFENIYAKKLWGEGSGWGSSPDNTDTYRKFLNTFMLDNNIRTVIDIGCGDWMFSKLINWSKQEYLGYDIVAPVITDCIKEYTSSNITFRCANILNDKVKPPIADLYIVKDVLQHWSNSDIKKFFKKTHRLFRYMLITNDFRSTEEVNQDAVMGSFQNIDITKPPFNIPATLEISYGSWNPHQKIKEVKTIYLINNHDLC